MADGLHTLANLLGAVIDGAGGDASCNPKRAAFERYQKALKGDDIDEQMAAFDDYLTFRGDSDGEITNTD